MWHWSDGVFNINSKGRVSFQSSPPVVFSLFRVLAVGLVKRCFSNIVKETIVPYAVKKFKYMFLHTALLTRMLSIIILLVIPFITKTVTCFPNILFSTTLTGQKKNQAVIVTVELLNYFCVSPVTLVVILFVSETFTHTSHLFLPYLLYPTALSVVTSPFLVTMLYLTDI